MRRVSIAYLASSFISLMGNAIAGVALPLIVLQSTGSALAAGTVAAATAIPAVLAGLLMGVVIDRLNRRTSSILTDVVSALSVGALPLVDGITGLSLGWFVLFGIIGSLGDIPGMTAREAMLPGIVRCGTLSSERLVGTREALGAVALLLGPATAGVLLSALPGSTVLWITAATSLTAALITLLIPRDVGEIVTATGTTATRPAGSLSAQLVEGWRALIGNRFLVVVTLVGLVSVFTLGALQGLVLPAYFTLIEQPALLGFVLTSLAVGMLIGGGLYAALGARLPRRMWLLIGLCGTTIGFTTIALLASPVLVFVGACVIGAFSGLFNSVIGVLMIERIPEELRGRIMGTQNAVMTAAPPAGIFLAGVVVEFATVNLAAVLVVVVWLIAVVASLRSRSLRSLEPDPAGQQEVATDA